MAYTVSVVSVGQMITEHPFFLFFFPSSKINRQRRMYFSIIDLLCCCQYGAQYKINDFMNYFTSKIKTVRDKIVTMQLSATVSHQIVRYRSPEEQFHSFSSIGN